MSKVYEVLNRAATFIADPKRWIRTQPAIDADGGKVDPDSDPTWVARACGFGALQMVSPRTWPNVPGMVELEQACCDLFWAERGDESWKIPVDVAPAIVNTNDELGHPQIMAAYYLAISRVVR